MTVATVQPYTERVDANSGAFDELFYDAVSKRAFARFHSGTTIGYEGLESSTWEAWKGADSKYRFWKLFVQPNYKGVNGDVEFEERKGEPALSLVGAAGQTASLADVSYTYNEDVNVASPAPQAARRFMVTIEVEADSLVQAATRFANEDGVTVVSVVA